MHLSQIHVPRTERSFQHPALRDVSAESLRATVEALAYPRHYVENRKANERARDWISEEFRRLGFRVLFHGTYDNVIAVPSEPVNSPSPLLGAHYDTVPTTPGADDNNSAIALCLEVARVLALHERVPVVFAVFNREEDGLLGSTEFVADLDADRRFDLAESHIFEMVGYFTDEPGSQSKPGNLPISLPDSGNFIGLLSNDRSNQAAAEVMKSAECVGSGTPLVSLKTYLGVERLFRDLLRSDHSPFWDAGLPALLWTDTSNFRNPNYHSPSDTPQTLNYPSLADVTRIVVGHLLGASRRKIVAPTAAAAVKPGMAYCYPCSINPL